MDARKNKARAPLIFSELSEDEATNIEGAKMFFANNPEEERRYIFLRDEFAKTLNSTDKEIYYLSEKGITQKEIAKRLGYKTHSAVSKRMKTMNKNFKEFLGFENWISNNLRRCSEKWSTAVFYAQKNFENPKKISRTQEHFWILTLYCILKAKNEIKKIKEENILKKVEIGISETASENKKRRGRPTVYQRDHREDMKPYVNRILTVRTERIFQNITVAPCLDF